MKAPTAILLAALLLPPPAAAQIDFRRFHTPAEVDAELARLPTRFPSRARVVPIGPSLRPPILAVKISDNPDVDEPDEGDVIFIALHHAREWIAAEMALYLAERLLVEAGTHDEVRRDLDRVQVWVIPVTNPEGFAFTQRPPDPAVTDPFQQPRMWRKNRRDNGDGTFGVDLNRNWGYAWGGDGASGSTYSELYRGPVPFSEPENIALRDFLNARRNLKAFVTYHSFAQGFLRPWRYTVERAPGESTLASITRRSIDRIRGVHGRTYIENLGVVSSGNVVDWVWGEKRVAAFTVELRPPEATGSFDPDPAEIIPSNQENYPAALALIHDAAAREVWLRDHVDDSGAEPSATWTETGWTRAFWESPDIWTVPEVPVAGTRVTLNVRGAERFRPTDGERHGPGVLGGPKHLAGVPVALLKPDRRAHRHGANRGKGGDDTVDGPFGWQPLGRAPLVRGSGGEARPRHASTPSQPAHATQVGADRRVRQWCRRAPRRFRESGDSRTQDHPHPPYHHG